MSRYESDSEWVTLGDGIAGSTHWVSLDEALDRYLAEDDAAELEVG